MAPDREEYDNDDGDDDEDYDEEEDDEEEYDYNEDENDSPPFATMSPNLMAALGMDVSTVKVETDWKPPERAGLAYCNRLISEENFRGALDAKSWNNYDNDVDIQMSRFFQYMEGANSHFNQVNRNKFKELFKYTDADSKHRDSDDESNEGIEEVEEDFDQDRKVFLSTNLLNALGLDSKKQVVQDSSNTADKAWEKPQIYGLKNSNKIIDVSTRYTTNDQKIVRFNQF